MTPNVSLPMYNLPEMRADNADHPLTNRWFARLSAGGRWIRTIGPAKGGHRVNQHRTRNPKDFCTILLIRHSESLHGWSPFGGDRDPTSEADLQAS